MRKLSIYLALVGACSVSASYADDIISRLSVLDQGGFAVDGNLSAQKYTDSEIGRFSSSASGTYKAFSSTAVVNANAGLGYGLEFFTSLPYQIRNHSQTNFNNGQSFTSNSTGFSDATFGLKYRVYKDADGENEVLAIGSFLHHSGSSGNMLGELDYLHAFSAAIKVALTARYTEVQGGSNSTAFSTYLMWKTSPQITFVPFVSAGNYRAYNTYSGYNFYQGGMELRYTPVKGWNITPKLMVGHYGERDTYFYANEHGAQSQVLASLIVQKEF